MLLIASANLKTVSEVEFFETEKFRKHVRVDIALKLQTYVTRVRFPALTPYVG